MHGLYEAWKRHGRLSWKCLVQPAINLSKDGFNITQAVGDVLSNKDIEDYGESNSLSDSLVNHALYRCKSSTDYG